MNEEVMLEAEPKFDWGAYVTSMFKGGCLGFGIGFLFGLSLPVLYLLYKFACWGWGIC